MRDSAEFNYGGTDNLEVMAEARNYNAWLSSLVACRTSACSRIVDFGAGIGTFSIPLLAPSRVVVGVEPDRKHRETLAAGGVTSVADLSQLSDGWADAIISLNVLEHIADDREILRILASKLCAGGVLLLYVPAYPLLYSAMDAKVGHYRRYRMSGLRRLVSGVGLDVAEARYLDSLGFLATLAYKCFGSRRGDIDRRALHFYDRWIFPASRVLDRLAWPYFGKNLLLTARKSTC